MNLVDEHIRNTLITKYMPSITVGVKNFMYNTWEAPNTTLGTTFSFHNSSRAYASELYKGLPGLTRVYGFPGQLYTVFEVFR